MFKRITQYNFIRSQVLSKEIEIFINDKPYQVDSDYTIWQACNVNQIKVPRFCFHESLNIAGNCRMCLVQVEKSPKPIASCAVQIMPGMKIKTNSEKTRIHRGAVVEFLLNNHPLDCPICDQAGECDLQDISLQYGYGKERFYEYRRAVEDKDYGPLVGTSMTRCITCTRCTRFTNEVAGNGSLGKVGRGLQAEIGTYIEKFVDNELSGNIVDLCPVGALTSLPYSYQIRPEEMKQTYTIDTSDAMGSNIQVDTRVTEMMRVLPRIHEEINQEWISDKTRYSFDGFKKQRLTKCYQRDEKNQFKDLDWFEAISLIKQKILETNYKNNSNQILASIGEYSDMESLTILKDLMSNLNSDLFNVHNIKSINLDQRSNYLFNTSFNYLEDADLILLIGSNIKYESPLLNSRIYRNVKSKKTKVFTIGSGFDLSYEFIHLGLTTEVLKEIDSNPNHPFVKRLQKAKLPALIIGEGQLQREDSAELYNLIRSISQKYNFINHSNEWNGFNIMHRYSSSVGAFDLGIKPKDGQQKVSIVLGDQIIPEHLKDSYVIYIGTQGDKMVQHADLILPALSPFEKEGIYVNSEGRPQLAKKCVEGPGLTKNTWEILRALADELNIQLPYYNLQELRMRIQELVPHVLKLDNIQESGLIIDHQEDSKNVNITILQDQIHNYYMNDSASRCSPTMAKCSMAFNSKKNENFINV